MLYYALKVMLSALVIVAVSEIAKRSSSLAAVIASLPLTSLLAFVWLRLEGAPGEQIGILSMQIFWLVLPSLVLFVVLSLLLRHDVGFWLALSLAIGATVSAYAVMLLALRRAGISA